MAKRGDTSLSRYGSLAEYNRKRHFDVTPEPSGSKGAARTSGLQFVVQKHRAGHLHYDFRLEHDGVMLSWAVPKGPSLDPRMKRLAMQTEDHPMDYNQFEGVIPEGEYGGGTVMIWDYGTWEPEVPDVGRALVKGDLKLRLHGRKLEGSWALVHTDERRWLLIKHRDDHASATVDLTIEKPRSAVSRRTLAGIARAAGATAKQLVEAAATDPPPAQKAAKPAKAAKPKPAKPKKRAAKEGRERPPFPVPPMLATLAGEPFHEPGWVYEEKYDGYRIVAHKDGERVRLLTRNLKDRTADFPEIAAAVAGLDAPTLVLDGEAVVFDSALVSRFQLMQRRDTAPERPPVYAVFDCMFARGTSLLDEPLTRRREILENEIGDALYLIASRRVAKNGLEAFDRASELGFEGLVAKDESSPYVPGKRTHSWLKIKVRPEDEFVIGGFTPPEGSREHFGAILVGAHDGKTLRYAGRVGSGYSRKTLAELKKLFAPLVRSSSPFADLAKEKGAVWLEPRLVAQIAYTEITGDGRLRQPVFLGLRDDKPAAKVKWPAPPSGAKDDR